MGEEANSGGQTRPTSTSDPRSLAQEGWWFGASTRRGFQGFAESSSQDLHQLPLPCTLLQCLEMESCLLFPTSSATPSHRTCRVCHV